MSLALLTYTRVEGTILLLLPGCFAALLLPAFLLLQLLQMCSPFCLSISSFIGRDLGMGLTQEIVSSLWCENLLDHIILSANP